MLFPCCLRLWVFFLQVSYPFMLWNSGLECPSWWPRLNWKNHFFCQQGASKPARLTWVKSMMEMCDVQLPTTLTMRKQTGAVTLGLASSATSSAISRRCYLAKPRPTGSWVSTIFSAWSSMSLGPSHDVSVRRANNTAKQALRLSPTVVARPKNFLKALPEILSWLIWQLSVGWSGAVMLAASTTWHFLSRGMVWKPMALRNYFNLGRDWLSWKRMETERHKRQYSNLMTFERPLGVPALNKSLCKSTPSVKSRSKRLPHVL